MAVAVAVVLHGAHRLPLVCCMVHAPQSQVFRRYAGGVFTYEISNRAFDVPYGDYFTTAHRFFIYPSPTTPGFSNVLLVSEVRVDAARLAR